MFETVSPGMLSLGNWVSLYGYAFRQTKMLLFDLVSVYIVSPTDSLWKVMRYVYGKFIVLCVRVSHYYVHSIRMFAIVSIVRIEAYLVCDAHFTHSRHGPLNLSAKNETILANSYSRRYRSTLRVQLQLS